MTDYIAENKKAWDASAPLHKSSDAWEMQSKGFAKPGFSTFDETATALLKEIGLGGKSVAQLGCNNGREILSALNMGAEVGTGFDQSTEFLAQARELTEISGLNAHFVETNILDIPRDYDAQFDLVIITIGVISWLPDLPALFENIERILKPGGQLFIYEYHPILDIFEPDDPDPFHPKLSYFQQEPYVEDTAITYVGELEKSEALSYSFFHPLGNIMTAFLEAGLTLQHFKEYPHSNREDLYDKYAEREAKLPMCYTLIGSKS